MTPYDALVIGGGPAGATVAWLLARAGWSVCALERKAFPRRKVCGEYLSATNLPLLEELGLAETFGAAAGPPVRRVALFARAACLTAALPGPVHALHGWGRALGREILDTLLLTGAARAGADVRQPWTVRALARHGTAYRCQVRCQTTGADHTLTAPVVVAAHGSWDVGTLPTLAGRASARPADLFGFKAHFRGGALPAGLMPLLAFPGGYGGLVHSDAGRVSLSCCIRRDRLAQLRANGRTGAGEVVLDHLLDCCRGARRVLEGAHRVGPWLAAGPIRPGIRARGHDGLFLVGNAAGEAHPVVAEGISMAVQGAWLLARLLGAWRRQGADVHALDQVGASYDRLWRQSFGPRLRVAAGVAHWAMRALPVAWTVPVLRWLPDLLGWGARLSGKASQVIPTFPG